jgi:hypothetical protein
MSPFRDNLNVREVTHIFCYILLYLANDGCSINEDYTGFMGHTLISSMLNLHCF